MKLRSLVKLPKYKRFTFEPRYYDAEKEERENRRKRILGETENEDIEGIKKRISFSFNRSRKVKAGTSMLQIFLMLFFMMLILGYLYLGNTAIYISVAFACVVYFYVRILKK
jgi:hypothetical protein